MTTLKIARSRRQAAVIAIFSTSAALAVSTAAALILVPVSLFHVGPELYGAWLGSGGILAWLAMIDLGIASLMVQRIARAYGRQDFCRIGEYLSTGFTLQIGLVVLLIAAAVVLARVFPSWMGIEGSDARALSTAFVLASVANGASILNNCVVGFLKALQIALLPGALAVVGVIAGALTTLVLLTTGNGLISIPIGLIVGTVLQLLANGSYAVAIYRREVPAPLYPSRETAREFFFISGPMFASKLSSAAMGGSDAALIAILLRPELATAYVLTRRAADVILGFLNMIGGATFAPFAHLAAATEGSRAKEVHRQIIRIYLGSGAIMVGAFFAGNRAFVHLWVGPTQFLGQSLTLLIGMAVLIGGLSAILNYLLGATGRIEMSSWINVGEATARSLAMVGLLLTLGVAGLPISVLLTAPVSAWISSKTTFRELNASGNPLVGNRRVCLVSIVVLLGGAFVGALSRAQSWSAFIFLMAGYGLMAGVTMISAVPELHRMVRPLRIR